MNRPLLLVGGLVLVLAIVVVAITVANRHDDNASGLPAVDEARAPVAYRIVYEVVTPDSQGTEEHVVQRPFGAHVVQRDADGEITAERWSDLGILITRSQGADAVRIDTAIAPAASDLRPDRFAGPLEAAKKLVVGRETAVGGRACQRQGESSTVIAEGGGPSGAGGDQSTSVPVSVDRCVDEQGLVLEERWTTAGGQRVLTKRAVQLELGDDVPAVDLPDAEPLPDAQGNGAVRKLTPTAVPPFVERWQLPTPEGFTLVGRFAVVPPRLSNTALSGDPGVALYTDVWQRGGDLLLLDQGAVDSGPPPFDPRSTIGPVDVVGIGPAELAVDLRLAEVRLARPDGGFVRVAGTLTPDELLGLAETLDRSEAAA